MNSQVQCRGCNIMLMYPQGASNVRCSQCSHITPIAGMQPSQAAHTRAQLQCSGCQIMLMYPRGSNNVQCAVCGVVNSAQQANHVAHLQCEGCRTWLMYAYGARSVKCAVCNAVSTPPPDTGMQGPPPMMPPQSQPQQPQQPQQQPARPDVVVENPPTLDEQGNETPNVMLGYKDAG